MVRIHAYNLGIETPNNGADTMTDAASILPSHRVLAIADGAEPYSFGAPEMLGTASSIADAKALVRAAHPNKTICHDDFYDADDAPNVYGIDRDGSGAFAIYYAEKFDT